MPSFGKSSMSRRAGLHPKLQQLLDRAILIIDFSIVCGHRGEVEQNKAYAEGNSEVQWPNSKHNSLPSLAVDIVPWPTQYADERRVMVLAGVILALAAEMDIKIRWGGDWDGDGDQDDQRLKDPYHFELVL